VRAFVSRISIQATPLGGTSRGGFRNRGDAPVAAHGVPQQTPEQQEQLDRARGDPGVRRRGAGPESRLIPFDTAIDDSRPLWPDFQAPFDVQGSDGMVLGAPRRSRGVTARGSQNRVTTKLSRTMKTGRVHPRLRIVRTPDEGVQGRSLETDASSSTRTHQAAEVLCD
jgi:hypothetical protein